MAKRCLYAAALGLLMLSGIARAEQHAILPKDTPASYRAECATCHVAIPPDLLTAEPWKEIMDNLGNHYGVNASISDTATRNEIREFLILNAGRASSMRSMRRGDPLRISDTLYFHRRHGKVKAFFHDSRVASPINCPACHVGSDNYDAKSLTPLAKQLLQSQ